MLSRVPPADKGNGDLFIMSKPGMLISGFLVAGGIWSLIKTLPEIHLMSSKPAVALLILKWASASV